MVFPNLFFFKPISIIKFILKFLFILFLSICPCNTSGVCHSLSSEFELKSDRLSGDEYVKVNLWRPLLYI
jgi:hypothetical protein